MYTNNMATLFAEGGMNDEGGTVDPVSGNDVPPGAMQNEVRDDIDAKLSEGEFVIPADVVRYIGLERLMKLRDEAKQGLSRMAEIGQMGNADQVENPEALHEDEKDFDSEIDDIMKEVDGEQMGEKQFAKGGAVYVPPADKDILAKYNIPRTSITNPALDVRLLKNAAGDSLYMTYFNDKPGGAIPAGYSVVDANPASRMTGTGFTTTTTGSTGDASVDSGNLVAGGTTNLSGVTNTSMTDLALANVPITGKDGKVSTPGGDTTTTDGGSSVNAYGNNITASADGSVSTGLGGFTLNPDGTVTANTLNKGLTAAAGLVNPMLGIAARVNNALATSSAKDFTRSIADTMGTNIDTTSTTAATAGPTGTGRTAAQAAADAAAAASGMGLSDAAAGAASQAAADVIKKGGNAADAASAGTNAASDVAKGESEAGKSSTEILGEEEQQAANRESLGDFNELDSGFNLAGSFDFRGGSSGGGGKYFDDQSMATMAMAKGGLVAKRTKKPTLAQKRGIASKK
jgi:hypothetical protein